MLYALDMLCILLSLLVCAVTFHLAAAAVADTYQIIPLYGVFVCLVFFFVRLVTSSEISLHECQY